MRKGIALFTALAVTVSLCSCGVKKNEQNNSPAEADVSASAAAVAEEKNGQEETADIQETAEPDKPANGQEGMKSEVEESAQIALIASQVKKWTKMDSDSDDGEPYCSYAVTDLDQNGRLEIIESSADQGSGRFTTSEYFQVNEAGDDLEQLSISDEEYSQDDIVSNMDTVYYDESTGEYHYITGDFATAGAATGFVDTVTFLTLREGSIESELLAVREREALKNGKFRTKYYKMTKKGKEKKLSKLEYDEEEIADSWFSGCAKSSVDISWFSFDRKISKYTQEELTELLKDSYSKFSTGTAVKKVKKKILGYSVQVPKIIQMEDQVKQEKLNQMIQKRIKKELKNYCRMKDMPFDLWGYYLTVKYAGKDEISILGEIEGYAEGAPHPWRGAYTINLDLEQERELSQKEILPKKYRKEVETLILNGSCQDVSEFASSYRKAVKELHGKNTKKLMESGEWKYVDVYYGKSKDVVGVVINTAYAVGSYAVYETYPGFY